MLTHASRFAIVAVLFLVPGVARAGCGCGAAVADAPCTQATLATVPVAQTFTQPAMDGVEFSVASCLDCGGSLDLLPLLSLPLIAFVLATAIKWVLVRRDQLIRLRLAS
jgi:ribose/xylose/arabinose/galactoside ABC-type transport system permease subunit